MTEDYLTLVGALLLATVSLSAYMTSLSYYSTPAPCGAAKLGLQNPGSEIVTYGKFRVIDGGEYIYLTCGLRVEKKRVWYIEKTEGVLTVGSTAEGFLYIR